MHHASGHARHQFRDLFDGAPAVSVEPLAIAYAAVWTATIQHRPQFLHETHGEAPPLSHCLEDMLERLCVPKYRMPLAKGGAVCDKRTLGED